ncbi:MAG TPA: orotidine-5'-phosphate decarboxylase, partial [Terriglobales bacterium]|nr:orotidine-5'-phosphate decarboxylase [Terriglobales bacterium]
MPDARERLIVALDVSSAAAAQKIVAAVGDSAFLYKVGKQLFTAEGPGIVRDLVASGRRVFLDLKFHDIPNTVAAAVAEACKLKVSMLTVHASGGSRMLKAATEAAASSVSKPLIMAVTVLTSFRETDVQEVGFSGRVVDNVLRLAQLARASGCGGIVTSAKEA